MNDSLKPSSVPTSPLICCMHYQLCGFLKVKSIARWFCLRIPGDYPVPSEKKAHIPWSVSPTSCSLAFTNISCVLSY